MQLAKTWSVLFEREINHFLPKQGKVAGIVRKPKTLQLTVFLCKQHLS